LDAAVSGDLDALMSAIAVAELVLTPLLESCRGRCKLVLLEVGVEVDELIKDGKSYRQTR
jgi:hypothetical protein